MATTTETPIQAPSTQSPDANVQPFIPGDKSNQLPGAAFKADPKIWYHLAVYYTDTKGNRVSSSMYPLGRNPSTSFWNYMAFNSPDGLKPAKFKIHPPKPNGFSEWEIDDGNYLCLSSTGWVYRASVSPKGWAIFENHLYNDSWGGPTGYKYDDVLVPAAYYIGMDLPLFTCELVPA